MNELPRQKLCEIVIQYGRSIGSDIPRCEGLLRDFCSPYRLEVSVLISALRERIPADLISSQNLEPYLVTVVRLTNRLKEHLGLAEDAARWAVESWALALGITPQLSSPQSIPNQSSTVANSPPSVPDAYRREQISQPNSSNQCDSNTSSPTNSRSSTVFTPKYGNFWLRLLAFLIDQMALCILAHIAEDTFGYSYIAKNNTTEVFQALELLLWFTLSWLYHALLESSSEQATLGKQAVRLVVTDLNGAKISFGQASGRYLSKFLSSIFLIGFIMAAFRERKQALHDLMANTLVVTKS